VVDIPVKKGENQAALCLGSDRTVINCQERERSLSGPE